ncbi:MULTISPECIES: hypothetical protein [unclassified Lysobacter]|uniref:hypothetical protein n=1 Tax=unclassified Lysobacter TaxID=2635362 RepID=UPI0006FF291E|nr:MULTISPECIES: hypothetical protein [unclassified Lysobacter]KQZ59581.1 hypothetical protein ASD53_05060 [Lysobacter sp. Root559]KRC36633.1 hypothetical protein ASE10_05835 [Lysobacter sp. Root76]KRD66727.1 hypothetical protein ASE45_15485 [Lysobacter sp. Root96]
MQLLLIPLLVLAMVLLWALLLPVALIQRYRYGKSRRRAIGWVVALNLFASFVSMLLFFFSAWIAGHWIADAPVYATIGVALGLSLGLVGLALTHFEPGPDALYYTPNRWLVLALTVIVAARLGFGLLQALRLWGEQAARGAWLSRQGGLLAVGGMMLGYYLSYALGLRRRCRRPA